MRFFVALVTLFLCLAPAAQARDIALSFDDAPRPATSLLTGQERVDRLITGLRRASSAEAVFFANTARMDAEGERRLRAYARAGHLIANHSATHRHLRDLSADEFLADVASADLALKRLPGFRPWFRYPYLDEGDTVEKRDAVRTGLQRLGYAQGYVTIDTYDWYLDSLAQQAVQRGDKLNMDALRDLYIEAIVASANFYDQLAVAHLGRSPRHVLLLHENDLAALFVEDLVYELERQGWNVIGAEVAYLDPIARQAPQTMLLGQGRVAALAHDAGAERASVFGPYEEEAELDAMFAARVIQR